MDLPIHDRAAYRIRSFRQADEKPKKYRATYELIDEQLQSIAVRCDLIGQAVFRRLTLTETDGTVLTLRPNRAIMPSRWLLEDSDNTLCCQFDQKIIGKLFNPIYKTVLAVLDGENRETMRLVNLHNKKAAVVLGLEWGKYALVRDRTPLAQLTTLPREKQSERRGLLGRLTGFLQSSDTALVSFTKHHPLRPAATLALYLLYRELTDTSGS